MDESYLVKDREYLLLSVYNKDEKGAAEAGRPGSMNIFRKRTAAYSSPQKLDKHQPSKSMQRNTEYP